MWFRQISNDSDTVISTRVRFARNLSNHKFSNTMNKKESKDVFNEVSDAVDKNLYKVFDMNDIDSVTSASLIEEHLISKELVNSTNSGLIINEDNTIVAMINEEDHLRIQSFESGFNIEKCYHRLVLFTEQLSKKLDFAVSDKYGYITSCPTNMGSAMRVSVMLHLPALAKIGLLDKLLDEVIAMGLSVRGLYGENTAGYGYMYQISNRQTLGISDNDIISKIKAVVETIIKQERKARNVLKESSIYLMDDVYRAYGILKNSRIISDDEALKLLSKLRLGVAMGMVNEVSLDKVQALMVDTQSNTLKTILKQDLSKEEEDIKRGEYIREELK